MKNKILKTIFADNMIQNYDTIIVGVSGGADSMCLLHFLFSNREMLKINVIAAHVNHCLRGSEADRDEAFVRNFCKQNDIKFELLKIDVASEAKRRLQGTEECGRNIRYDFFDKLSQKYGAKIATAHTASDNAETILFNLTRGAGLNGMCGIKHIRGNIIRPLINMTREDIEKYCYLNGINYMTDSTNLEDEYTRNVIRHNVIPVLKQINNGFEQSVSRLSNMLQADNNYITNQAMDFIEKNITDKGIPAEKMKEQDISVLSRIIYICTEEKNCFCTEQKHIDLIIKAVENGVGEVNLPQGITAVISQNYFRIIKRQTGKIENVSEKISGKDVISILGKKYSFLSLSRKEYEENRKFNKLLFNNCLDYDIISSNTVLRNKIAGDVFRQRGRGVSKPLKKLFNESKIPRENRMQLALIADDRILWVEGFGVADFAAVTDKTERVLYVQVEK